ncbi:aminoglycoside phosphotransferase family protein [Polymorphospora sp. NPDC051019]|uniref:aminoglycoside phosphotransferase family protein n=1 Tax=Polymorphospora sp. NPDC051019 TaxID=3155725 RepID=UPI0034246DB8
MARREIAVSRWLASNGLRAVRALDDFTQPTVVDGHPVSWWELLPAHRTGTPEELGLVLRDLHRIPTPRGLGLPPFHPVNETWTEAFRSPSLSCDNREWVQRQADELTGRYLETEFDSVTGIHGDAWQGNLAVSTSLQPVLLDFEEFCIGPTDWDLIPIAVDYTHFSRISESEYRSFAEAYGLDVTHRPYYGLLAGIQLMRWTSFVINRAAYDDAAAEEAAYRISCLRGEVTRPWRWSAF